MSIRLTKRRLPYPSASEPAVLSVLYGWKPNAVWRKDVRGLCRGRSGAMNSDSIFLSTALCSTICSSVLQANTEQETATLFFFGSGGLMNRCTGQVVPLSDSTRITLNCVLVHKILTCVTAHILYCDSWMETCSYCGDEDLNKIDCEDNSGWVRRGWHTYSGPAANLRVGQTSVMEFQFQVRKHGLVISRVIRHGSHRNTFSFVFCLS